MNRDDDPVHPAGDEDMHLGNSMSPEERSLWRRVYAAVLGGIVNDGGGVLYENDHVVAHNAANESVRRFRQAQQFSL